MDDWDAINRTSGLDELPEKPLACFLTRFHDRRPQTRVLDIGPGRSQRHYLYCARQGFDVESVDISHVVPANYHCDIQDFECEPETYDLVLDMKTLSSEREPPYAKIHSWIKSGGFLFSMIPTEEHRKGNAMYDLAFPIKNHPRYDYEFTRMATRNEVDELFSMFSETSVYKLIDPVVGGYLFSWCVEARK